MAVYTLLPRGLIQSMGAVFPEVGGDIVDVEGIPQGSINTTYRVTTKERVWFLRVNEGKPFEALLHERDVLAALAAVGADRLGAVTPRMALSVPGGSFFPVDVDDLPSQATLHGFASGDDGEDPARVPGASVSPAEPLRTRRWACWFPALPGRDLGVFEVTPAHTSQIGRFLGRFHRALRGFRRRRRNPYGAPVVRGWLRRLAEQGVLPDIVQRLSSTLCDLERRRRLLPAGLIHGDLFVDNTKWEDQTLRAVFDWEMAGRDHLMLDVAVALCAWCFVRDGERLTLNEDAAAALVDGYRGVRDLAPSERRGFFTELRFAALRFTASRIRDFEAPSAKGSGGERRYLDYRDFLARLDVVEGRGERGVRALLRI